MRYLFTCLVMILLITACNKQQKDTDMVDCPEPHTSWLEQKKHELSPCTCLVAIYEGTYRNETVYEIRVTDPLCNGINSVHKQNGLYLFHGQDAAYQSYLTEVQNLRVIWTCSKSKQ